MSVALTTTLCQRCQKIQNQRGGNAAQLGSLTSGAQEEGVLLRGGVLIDVRDSDRQLRSTTSYTQVYKPLISQ